MTSPWVVGIDKISDVERIVTPRVEELASAPALKPSSTARSEANRNTAMATLITVRNVRRLLRLALFSTSLRNFMLRSPPAAALRRASPFRGAGRAAHALRRADRVSP